MNDSELRLLLKRKFSEKCAPISERIHVQFPSAIIEETGDVTPAFWLTCVYAVMRSIECSDAMGVDWTIVEQGADFLEAEWPLVGNEGMYIRGVSWVRFDRGARLAEGLLAQLDDAFVAFAEELPALEAGLR